MRFIRGQGLKSRAERDCCKVWKGGGQGADCHSFSDGRARCLQTNMQNLGNKREELEIHLQPQGYNAIRHWLEQHV